MAEGDKRPRRSVKIGVKERGGPPPGYLWNVALLGQAYDEAMSFLNEDQYSHLACQVRELAAQEEPTRCETVDVRPIEDFHEIRDKGGILGKINARIFFFNHKETRTIVILGAIKKENDGPTPIGDLRTMRRRKRIYLESLPPTGLSSA
jgi:phage-related protein